MYKVLTPQERFDELYSFASKLIFEEDEKSKEKQMLEFTTRLYTQALNKGLSKDKLLYEDQKIAKLSLSKYMRMVSIVYLIFSILGLIDQHGNEDNEYEIEDDSAREIMEKIKQINSQTKSPKPSEVIDDFYDLDI